MLLTVTTISVYEVCPALTPGTYGQLSLTVNRKFKVLEIELNASILTLPPAVGPVIRLPARMVDNLGNSLVGLVEGRNDNQLGPVALVGLATLFAPNVVARSFCSQQ